MLNIKKRILVTGGTGFIACHYIEHLLKNTDWEIVVLDKLATNGLVRLRDINCFNIERALILSTDFTKPLSEGVVQEIGEVDYICHLGAETHVDDSIANAEPFVLSNVLGTMNMLEFARKQKNLKMFNMFSTDEVYGPAPLGVYFKETDRYNSTNPYSATKAAAEQLCLAYANTYRIPVFITNTMNVFGERQGVNKFIPSTIKKVLNGETVIIHSDPTRTKAGTRFYIHARNVSNALHFLLDKAKTRESYNIVGEQEVDNLAMAQMIADVLGKPLKYEMLDYHSSRPGHDLRYALDGTKLKRMGWTIPVTFEESLKKTIEWMVERKDVWLK